MKEHRTKQGRSDEMKGVLKESGLRTIFVGSFFSAEGPIEKREPKKLSIGSILVPFLCRPVGRWEKGNQKKN